MDFTNSAAYDVVSEEEHQPTSITVDLETNCWGCGLRVLVSPFVPAFKCGWCGALTKQNEVKCEKKYFRWIRFRDRCFIGIVLPFMLLFTCGGIWAVYPVVFSVSYACGVFHLTIAVLLFISTLSTFCLAAFRSAGVPPMIPWGSYPTVGKNGLENYTFCHYCSRPKPPRAHHCRSCGMCILDMDHHCPFIGNCVGAANHRSFILFIMSTVTSTAYVAIMTSYAVVFIWPPLDYKPFSQSYGAVTPELIFRVVKDNILAFSRSSVFLPARGFFLVYLFMASVSVGSGLAVLLWQQLCYIYAGETYLSHLSSVDSEETTEKDCRNLVRFFGCPYSAAIYLPSYWKSAKRHDK